MPPRQLCRPQEQTRGPWGGQNSSQELQMKRTALASSLVFVAIRRNTRPPPRCAPPRTHVWGLHPCVPRTGFPSKPHTGEGVFSSGTGLRSSAGQLCGARTRPPALRRAFQGLRFKKDGFSLAKELGRCPLPSQSPVYGTQETP